MLSPSQVVYTAYYVNMHIHAHWEYFDYFLLQKTPWIFHICCLFDLEHLILIRLATQSIEFFFKSLLIL